MSSPGLVALHKLRRLGFRCGPVLDDAGRLEMAYFARQRHDALEVVLAYNEAEARAYRLRPAEGHANPLHFDAVSLEHLIPRDDAVTVVHRLLSEPSGGGPRSGHRRTGA